MTIFEAEEYDFKKARRRNITIAVVVVVVLILAGLGWWFRHWPEERVAGRFMAALENKDYKAAYGIWLADKDWEQHPQQHSNYSFADFYRDWGPSGDLGVIQSYQIVGSTEPKDSYNSANGVVVAIKVNGRPQTAAVWVTKKDHTMSFSPFDVVQ